MSFREKSSWISAVSMFVIYGLYFWRAMGPRGGSLGKLLGTIFALVVVQVALTVSVAIWAPKDAKAPLDERDKWIDLRATRFAYLGLASGIFCACVLAAVDARLAFGVNTLLLMLVVAEILRCGCQIVQYRRGA